MSTLALLRSRVPAPALSGTNPPASLTRRCDPESLRAPGLPLVSVVTVVRNAESTLERAIRSVREQTYPAIEHIVVDGASTDGTGEIIRTHADWIAASSSEPDAGLYDAMNKAIASTTGDAIVILNADDWYEPDFIEASVDELRRSGADFTFGDIHMHGYRGQDFRMPGDPDYASVIRRDVPRTWHTTMLCRRSVYERAGLYRLDMKVAADYDWQIRVFNAGCRGAHAAGALAHVTAGGVSTASQRTALKEGFVCSVRNGYPVWKAAPHWTYRWIANDHPRLHQKMHRAGIRARAGRHRLARLTMRAWHALGPLRGVIPGKKTAMRVLGVAPPAPANVSASAGTASNPASPAAVSKSGAGNESGGASEHKQETRIAAFIEARHRGSAISDRGLEILLDRANRWQWAEVRGDHPAAGQLRALAAVLGLDAPSVSENGSGDADRPGLLADLRGASSIDGTTKDGTATDGAASDDPGRGESGSTDGGRANTGRPGDAPDSADCLIVSDSPSPSGLPLGEGGLVLLPAMERAC